MFAGPVERPGGNAKRAVRNVYLGIREIWTEERQVVLELSESIRGWGTLKLWESWGL